jgi:hypothetical protein
VGLENRSGAGLKSHKGVHFLVVHDYRRNDEPVLLRKIVFPRADFAPPSPPLQLQLRNSSHIEMSRCPELTRPVRPWPQHIRINFFQLSSHKCGTLQRCENDW